MTKRPKKIPEHELLRMSPNPKPNRFQIREAEINIIRQKALENTYPDDHLVSDIFNESDEVQLKQLLVEKLKSSDSAEVKRAIGKLQQLHWLQDGSLRDFSLENAQLSGLTILDADLAYVNLHGANLSGAYLGNVKMQGVNLTQADMVGVIIEESDMQDAQMDGADLRSAWISNNLARASLKDADLREVFLIGNLQSVIFERANLEQAWFRKVDLRGSTFKGAALRGLTFDYVMLSRDIILPDGTLHQRLTNHIRQFMSPDDDM